MIMYVRMYVCTYLDNPLNCEIMHLACLALWRALPSSPHSADGEIELLRREWFIDQSVMPPLLVIVDEVAVILHRTYKYETIVLSRQVNA